MKTLALIFFALLILFSIGFIVFFIYAFIYSGKLSHYLKEKNYDRWCELTTTKGSLPGWGNLSKSFAYLYGNLDDEDEKISKYKYNTRFGFRKSLFMLIALCINIIILAALIMYLDYLKG